MNIKDVSSETADENEKHVIGNWKKSDPCYKVAENLAKCVWLDGKQDQHGYFTEEVSKQNVEGTA